MKWLFLVHQVQTPRSRERVKVWRAVKQVGAVLYRNSVYVLPYSPERQEDFQWLCQQIRDAKGEASIFVSEAGDAREDSALCALFVQRADEDYAALLARVERLQTRLDGATTNQQLGERARAALTRAAQQAAEALAAVQWTDFFQARSGPPVRHAMAMLTQRLSAVQPQPHSPAPVRVCRPREFRGRTWATRPQIHIDRLCSAWLIRRFIDPKAHFAFAPEGKLPAGAIPFDTFGAEFSHHGEDCTFETLLKAFQLKDRALCEMAEIVHDIDMKDGRFGRGEAGGLDLIVRALGGANSDDHDTLKTGGPLLDALYQYLATAKPKGRKG